MTSMKSDPSLNQTKPLPNQVHNPYNELRPEEVKVYKDCLSNMYLKGGVPFAFLREALRYVKQPVKQRNFSQIAIGFFGNVLLGTFLFSPYCYYKLAQVHAKLMEEQKRKEKSDISPVTEDAQFKTWITPDFSYPSDTMSSFTEPEASFSSDFSSSTILYDDEKDLKKPETTYDDLRAWNRKNIGYEPSVSSLNSEFPLPPSASTPASTVPPSTSRRVVKNKYGDEIE